MLHSDLIDNALRRVRAGVCVGGFRVREQPLPWCKAQVHWHIYAHTHAHALSCTPRTRNAHTNACAHAHAHSYTYTLTHTHAHRNTYKRTHTQRQTWTHTHTHTPVRAVASIMASEIIWIRLFSNCSVCSFGRRATWSGISVSMLCVNTCCSALQCVAVCCSALWRVAACCSVKQCVQRNVYQPLAREHMQISTFECGAVWCSMMQYGVVWCKVVQFICSLTLVNILMWVFCSVHIRIHICIRI